MATIIEYNKQKQTASVITLKL